MGDVAEQRPDEQPPERQPRSDLEHAQNTEPAAPDQAAPQLDPEQLRQFQQFQQFQDFLRFNEAQKQGGQVVPGQSADLTSAQGQPPAQTGQQPWLPADSPGGTLQTRPDTQPARPPLKAPRWLKRLGGKVLSLLLLLLLLGVAGKIAYDKVFPTQDENLPAPEAGRGTYSATELLQANPYRATQLVYQQIAQNRPDLACGNFAKPAQQKFAEDMGFRDCKEAVEQLSRAVQNKTDYATSLPMSSSDQPAGNVVQVSSCAYPIKGGGRSLGLFTVTRQLVDSAGLPVKGNQWLITGHEKEPDPCPPAAPSSGTAPTR